VKTYRVVDIITCFGVFLDDEYEAKDLTEAREKVYNDIIDNLGNYIDIELEEVVENNGILEGDDFDE
jgi:hypothetical protein